MPDLPIDFIIIGAQKAGSTTVASGLRRHQACWMPDSEVPFFEDPYFDSTRRKGLSQQLADHSGGRLLGIKRPDYLGRPEVPARIAEECPEAKLICVLRDPVRRTVSAYYWYLQTRLIPFMPLNNGLTRILDEWDGVGPAVSLRSNEIIRYSLYGAALERYLKVFRREQLVVIDGCEMEDSSWRTTLASFLGIAAFDNEGYRRSNPGVYDYRRIRVLRARSLVFPHGTSSWGCHRIARMASGVVTRTERALLGSRGQSAPETLDASLASRLDGLFRDDQVRVHVLTADRMSS